MSILMLMSGERFGGCCERTPWVVLLFLRRFWMQRGVIAMVCGLLVMTGCRQVRPSAAKVTLSGGSSCISGGVPMRADFSLLTFNIHGLPCWLTGESVGRYGRLSEAIREMDPDFVLLQEVWMKRAMESIPKDGEWSVASDGKPLFLCRRHGLATLSRYPILSSRFYPFKAGRFPDSLVSKGALRVTVDLGGGRPLNVWNLHLQAGNYPKTRKRQLEELRGWIEQDRFGQVADWVGGDFNFTPDSEEYGLAARYLGEDVQGLAQQPHWPTYGVNSGGMDPVTLDYVFLRADRTTRTLAAYTEAVFERTGIEGRFSDHCGLRTEVVLESGPSLRLVGGDFANGDPAPVLWGGVYADLPWD